jgi:tryptophanyl-tRNA synthetase
MSKSAPSLASRILLTDTESQIRSKFRSAVTDSIQYITYDPVNRPGTSNLLNILAACTNEQVEEVAKRYSSKNHSDLKTDVGEAVEIMLQKPRAEFHRLREDKDYLAAVAKEGAEKAKERTSRTMTGVRKLVGLY